MFILLGSFTLTLGLMLALTAGFILLSLSLPRNYNLVKGQRVNLPKRVKWIFRFVGYSLLFLALILAITLWGIALGFVYYIASITLIIFLISMVYTYKPQCLRFITF